MVMLAAVVLNVFVRFGLVLYKFFMVSGFWFSSACQGFVFVGLVMFVAFFIESRFARQVVVPKAQPTF